MTDSIAVLGVMKVVYTIYTLAIMSLFAWFAYSLTAESKPKGFIRIPFYGYIALLVFVGVSIHILTFNKIPWVEMDLKRAQIKPDKTFNIIVEKQKFILPSERLMINCNEKVLFNVDSKDLTYGFGLFRKDNSMLFQMQVVPGSKNDLLWQFGKNGVYTIRSTEYSGPVGGMVVKDAVEVQGCK